MEIESFSWCSRPWALTYPLGRYNMETLSTLLTDHLWGEFSGYWWIISGLLLSFYQIYMITSSIGNISALLAFCAGNSPLTGESPPPPSQTPVTRSFEVFFDLRLNKRLCKHWRRRWFKTSLCSLWRHFSSSVISNLLFCQDDVIKSSRQDLAILCGTSRVLILAPPIKRCLHFAWPWYTSS